MALMDRQMAEMNRYLFEADRQMTKELDDMVAQSRQMQRDMDADIQRALRDTERGTRELLQQEPGIRIQRKEERGSGSYRYYQSIHISTGSISRPYAPPAHNSMASPLLLGACIIAGAYAAVTSVFWRNYELTTYSEQGKWKLVLLWPVLASLSSQFRQQFIPALRGTKPSITRAAGTLQQPPDA